MKITFKTVLFAACLPVGGHAQTGKLYITGKEEINAGIITDFVYEPSKGTVMPGMLKVKLAYYSKSYFTKTLLPEKAGDKYEFSFAIPDSVDVIIAAILNEKGEAVDNNMDKGFIIYPPDKKGRSYSSAAITKVNLLNGFASYYLQLKYTTAELIKMYETVFLQQPALKQGDNYLSYLYLLYSVNLQKAAGLLLAFARQKKNENTGEAGLLQAVRIYKYLKKEQEVNNLEERIIGEYAKGQLAKEKFWSNYLSNDQRTDSVINAGMIRYKQQFDNIEPEAHDRFLMDIISNCFSKNDSAGIEKTELLIHDKTDLASRYNNLAWRTISNPGETGNLNMARLLSGHSLQFISDRIANPLKEDDSEDFLLSLDAYMDTYALILFKKGEYDSAFFYQDSILKRGSMSVEGKERYALFAEKAKGILFTKQFIETEIREGEISSVMLTQLQNIYKQLNIPAGEYAKIRQEADARKRRNTAKTVKEKFGLAPPKNFQLKDLQGKQVSLSFFKNKVVLLDFWATWCEPCRASFPKTQEIIKQYKKDPDVVFLFIDTWENKEFKVIQKNSAEFIRKNNYDFRVLVDEKNKVAAAFKVDGIPTAFILDKKGNIAYMGYPSENLANEIEAIKSYQ